MKVYAPYVLIGLAVVTLTLLLAGNDSYGRIASLRETLRQQHEMNENLAKTVDSARAEIYGLEHDKRALEKAARNELGMARSDEIIYLFEK